MNKQDWDAHYTALRVDPKQMTRAQFFALPEYSCSQPTGVYFGKQWRSNLNAYVQGVEARWVLHGYVPNPDNPKMARITTTPMDALEGEKP